MIRIDGYSDLVAIGHGGLGDVYRARRDSTGGTVAIKVLRDVSDESVAWNRTRRELTALVALTGHANVVQLVEVLDLDAGPALVMEYAPNGSVADLLRERGGTLTTGEAVLVGRQTAAALAAAHELGIVHRDVKPQNLLVDAYGQVKLCDFGVAALTRSEEFRTRTNALSMRYASPEDLDEEAVVGPASDVYSLGATILHLVHGAPPSLKERLAPWVPPGSEDERSGSPVDAVLADCLRPDPADRPTAAAVHERLEQLDWTLADRRRALDVEGVRFADLGEISARTGGTAAADDAEVVPVDPGDGGEVDAARPPAGPPPARDRDEVTTARRPDAPPPRPRPPAAVADRPGRGRWLVAAAIVAVLAAAVAVAMWPAGEADAPPSAATAPSTEVAIVVTATPSTSPRSPTLTDRPAGLIDLTDPSIVWPFGEPGECLVQLADRDELVPISCDEPHDLQRTAVGQTPLDLDDLSDGDLTDADIEAVVEAACRDAAEEFVGTPYADSELEAPFTRPSVDSFERESRYQCFVGRTGERLIGDARDSGR